MKIFLQYLPCWYRSCCHNIFHLTLHFIVKSTHLCHGKNIKLIFYLWVLEKRIFLLIEFHRCLFNFFFGFGNWKHFLLIYFLCDLESRISTLNSSSENNIEKQNQHWQTMALKRLHLITKTISLHQLSNYNSNMRQLKWLFWQFYIFHKKYIIILVYYKIHFQNKLKEPEYHSTIRVKYA